MPERLTDSLVRLGKIDASSANEALHRQVMSGGALDTALLELELVSEPGKGTEVSCHLPLEPRGKGVPPELALMGSTTAKLSETV